MNRIDETFTRLAREGRMGLLPFLTAGFPTLDATERLAVACVAAGADGLELGVPFSDPLADGTTLQHASEVALRNGASLAWTLETASRLRARLDVPLVLMTYYNPVHHYGGEAFITDARAAGVDGAIIIDLPSGEARPLLGVAEEQEFHVIQVVTPTTTTERLDEVGRTARGFVYCVSLLGTTGGRAQVSDRLPDFMARVRTHVPQPLLIGFGIARPEHVRAVRPYGDAVVVGSAVADLIAAVPSDHLEEALRDYVASLCAACDAAPVP
jgi:tryptophan synthase alpha chain